MQYVNDPTGITQYTFDAVSNLIQVSQGNQTRSFSYDSLHRLVSATNPESGTVLYSYDNAGNLVTRTDAAGKITCFGTLTGSNCASGYDALNRPTRKSYSGGVPAVTYNYDYGNAPGSNSLGQLTMVQNDYSTTFYTSFDAMGNVVGSSQALLGNSYNFSYTYNLAGALTSEMYPSGRVVNTSYDGANRVNAVTGTLQGQTKNYADPISYCPHGGLYLTGRAMGWCRRGITTAGCR